MSNMFLLIAEFCNGEYGDAFWRRTFSSLDVAMKHVAEVVKPEWNQLYRDTHEGKEPSWEETNPDQWQFRTGNWGYTSFEIYRVPHDEIRPSCKHEKSNWVTEEDDGDPKIFCRFFCSYCGKELKVMENKGDEEGDEKEK